MLDNSLVYAPGTGTSKVRRLTKLEDDPAVGRRRASSGADRRFQERVAMEEGSQARLQAGQQVDHSNSVNIGFLYWIPGILVCYNY